MHKRRPQTKWITFRVNVYNIDFLLSKVYAYDPTVSFPPERGNSISFQKLGVAAKRDEAKKMETLKDLVLGNGDDKSRIFYLKVIIKRVVLWMDG